MLDKSVSLFLLMFLLINSRIMSNDICCFQSSSSKHKSSEGKHRKQNSIKDYISRTENESSSRRNSRSRSRSPGRKSRRRNSRTPSPKRSRYHSNDQRSEEKENRRDRRDKFNRGYSTNEDSSPDIIIVEDNTRNNSVKSSINNAILQEMINVEDDDDEPVTLIKEEVPYSNSLQHVDTGNESEVDIMDSTDSHDIKRELEHNLHKDAAESLLSPSNNNNNKNKSNRDEDNNSNTHRHSDKKPKTKQAERMLDILNKGTGVVKPELATTSSTTTASTSTSSNLNKNSVAQAVVKYLTKYLHDKRIKDKVKRQIIFPKQLNHKDIFVIT